jgi:uncharacterized protein YecT (DUF1311 family)
MRLLIVVTAAVIIATPACGQDSATAAQCGPPRTPIDQTICTTPTLAAADMAMAIAERALERELAPAQRSALLLDQQIWLRARAGSCGALAGGAVNRCLLAQTEARRRMLIGGGINRDRGTPQIYPSFFRDFRPGRYEIEIAYPQIRVSTTAEQQAFNKAALAMTLGDRALMTELRTLDASRGEEGPRTNLVFYDIHYLGPRIATVVLWVISGDRRWDHPFTTREPLVFDFRLGRALRPGDVFGAPGQAATTIAGICKRQLAVDAQKQGWRLAGIFDPAAVVGDFHSWAPGRFSLDILFDPGWIAPVSDGMHACRLGYTELRTTVGLKSTFPLSE